MKRTTFLLAPLTAIILLSCSFLDNPNSSVEEMDSSQIQTLNKVAQPSDSHDYAVAAALSSSSKSYSADKSIGVVMTTSGLTDNSNEYAFIMPGTLPTSAVITKVEFKTGTLTYTGAVSTNYFQIRKGTSTANTVRISGISAGGSTITTNYFNGLPAKDTWYVSFNGTCAGFGGALFCSKLYDRTSLVLYFEY